MKIMVNVGFWGKKIEAMVSPILSSQYSIWFLEHFLGGCLPFGFGRQLFYSLDPKLILSKRLTTHSSICLRSVWFIIIAGIREIQLHCCHVVDLLPTLNAPPNCLV